MTLLGRLGSARSRIYSRLLLLIDVVEALRSLLIRFPSPTPGDELRDIDPPGDKLLCLEDGPGDTDRDELTGLLNVTSDFDRFRPPKRSVEFRFQHSCTYCHCC